MTCTNCGSLVDASNRFCPKCGASVQFQPPASPYSAPQPPPWVGPTAAPPQKSSGCGKIILIVGIILLLIGGGVAAAIYFGYHKLEQTLKSSEAYTVALKALKENPDVQERLGDIQDTGFPLGSFNQDASGSGQANFMMSVHGTKGDGQYHAEMIRRNSIWSLQRGSVRLANGGTITIAEPGSDNNDETNTNELTPLPPAPSTMKGTINGGVLNGNAISLPQPAYPPVARSARRQVWW